MSQPLEEVSREAPPPSQVLSLPLPVSSEPPAAPLAERTQQQDGPRDVSDSSEALPRLPVERPPQAKAPKASQRGAQDSKRSAVPQSRYFSDLAKLQDDDDAFE
jgi:hypothetical protein